MKRILICLSFMSLAACSGGDVRETLGLDHRAPDEFRVLTRPPLTIPPEFELRPPAEQEDEFHTEARKQAESILFSNPSLATQPDSLEIPANSASTAVAPVLSGDLESPADSKFLHNAGADHADPDVRSKIIKETAQQEIQEESVWDGLNPLGNKNEPVVDPKAEKERLEKNKKEQKPVTEGETPTTTPKSPGVLQQILP